MSVGVRVPCPLPKLSCELGQTYLIRLENLRYLCPNCHALTETYRGKNKKDFSSSRNIIDEKTFVNALKNNENIRQALIALGLNPQGGNYIRAKNLKEQYGI